MEIKENCERFVASTKRKFLSLEEVYAAWGDIQNDVYMVKFDREAVKELLNGVSGDVELKVIGKVESTPFEGSDTIRVINKGKK